MSTKRKLTKTEIRAVATEIQYSIRKEIREKEEKEKEKQKKEFYKTPLGKAVKKVLEFPEGRFLISDYNLRNFMHKNSFTTPSLDDIERAIIIEQIGTKDVDKIIKAVTLKFKKDE